MMRQLALFRALIWQNGFIKMVETLTGITIMIHIILMVMETKLSITDQEEVIKVLVLIITEEMTSMDSMVCQTKDIKLQRNSWQRLRDL